MKVAELIKELAKFDQDDEVMIEVDFSIAFASIVNISKEYGQMF